MRPSNLLAVALLATTAAMLPACGSTIERDDGLAEDGASDGVEDDGSDGISGGSDDGSDDGTSSDGSDDGGEEPCLEPREAGCPYAPAE